MLMVVCGGISLCEGENLKCDFSESDYSVVGLLYLCDVKSFENQNNDKTIDRYIGRHLPQKSDSDVNAISIGFTNTKYIPANIGYLSHLSVFTMIFTQLVEIRSKDFNGMENLEVLSFFHNNLTFLPLDVFSTLTQLRVIFLTSNQIKVIPNGIFSNNIYLERINLDDNQIKFIGSSLFNGLTNLNNVHLKTNICIDKEYTGKTEIIQLMKNIKMSCHSPKNRRKSCRLTTRK